MNQATNAAEEAAAAFQRRLSSTGEYSEQDIALICSLATHPDTLTAEAASRVFFTRLVEPLSDAFDPALVAVCDRVLAQAVASCARSDTATALHDTLERFGLAEEGTLVERSARLRESLPIGVLGPDLRKVVILSRVTWGADVAINSVFLAHLRDHCPEAELVLLGGDDLREVFGGDPKVRLRRAPYPRQGTLGERFVQWPGLAAVVEGETAGLRPEQWAVIDPESRMTQLGVLPVVADESRYLLFPSRGYPTDDTASLGSLAARWIGDACGTQQQALPYVALPLEHTARTPRLLGGLRGDDEGMVIAVNFAVGANPQKRLDDAFEEGLLRDVLKTGGRVVLASGGDEADIGRARCLAERLAQDGADVFTASDDRWEETTAPQRSGGSGRLLVWEGSLGGFSTLIAGSNAFLGYDSACTHIAAALGVPTVAIFGWHPNDIFVQRWTPCGAGEVRVVVAQRDRPEAGEQTANDALAALREVLSPRRSDS